MKEVYITHIYHNFNRNDNTYIVTFANKKIDRGLPVLDDINCPSYSDKQKEILREYCKNTKELANEYEYIESWIDADSSSTGLARVYITKVVEHYNNQNFEQDNKNLSYFTYIFKGDNKATFSKECDKTIINIYISEIESKEARLIHQDIEKLSFEQIDKIIKENRILTATEYAVMTCEACQNISIFNINYFNKIGTCSICGASSSINNPFYRGYDIVQAGIIKKEEINKLDHKITSELERINGTEVFVYLNKPYTSYKNSREKLHDLIYLEKDGKAIFKIDKNSKVTFKNEYIKYVSSYDKNLIDNAISELNNLLIRKSKNDYIDEDVALYWYYHNFDLGTNKLDDKDILFVKGEVFKDVDCFIDNFVKASSDKKLFYLSLINDVYISSFFNKKERVFKNNNIEETLTKLVYQKTSHYIYINRSESICLDLGTDFLDDLIKDDELAEYRYQFLTNNENILKELNLPEDNTYFVSDSYAYNAYIYSLYKNNGYYYYRHLKLPIKKGITSAIKDIIRTRYLHLSSYKDKDRDFFDLVYIYKEKYLDADYTAILNTYVEKALNGINTETYSNIDEIYFRVMSDENKNDVEFIYNDEIDTLPGHIKTALNKGKLNDFIKDKNIDNITKLLFKEKRQTIFDNALKVFNNMIKEIDEKIK